MREIFLRKQTNILSAAFVIMVTYGLSFIVGLVKTRLLLSYFFGSSAPLLDVYYAAFLIPDTVFQLLVIGSLSAAFLPTFSRYLAKNETDAWHIASATLNIILILFLLISTLIFIFAPTLSRLIAPGFTPDQISLLIKLLRIMLTAQIFFSISGFLTSVIQSHQRFLIPALAPVVYNIGIILGIIFLSPTLGILGPTIGVVIGAILHMLIQIPIAYKLGFRFRLLLDTRHPGVREVFHLMPPRAIAQGVDQIEQFVAVTLASLLSAGSLSLLNASRLLYTIPSTLFGTTIGQAAFPSLSQAVARQDLAEFKKIFVAAFLQIAFIALPVSILFIILRIPIVRIVFGGRTFPWEATLLTGKTVAALAASAGFYAVMQLVIRGFYALHDTDTPFYVGLGAAIFNAAFSVLAIYIFKWGIVGIAVAISATTILETLLLTVLLYRKATGLKDTQVVLIPLAKIVAISFLMGMALWAPMRLLDKFVFDTTRTFPLIILTVVTSLIGFSVYLFLSYLFKVEEFSSFIDLIKRFTNWRKIFASPPSEALIVPAPDQN